MDAATIRAWGADNGYEVSGKGPLSQALKDAYSAAHPGPNGDAAPDYPPGMTDADFETAEAAEPDDATWGDTGESPPRPVSPKPRGSRSRGRTLTVPWKRGSPSGKPKPKSKPKQPRVSTAELIGSAWRIGAKLAQPMPPMYRVLRLQSVIAGPLLDDQVKGTLVDPFLQPLARLSQAGETVSALAVPPVAIGAMFYHLKQTEGEPNPVVMQACAEMLRHGLIAMMRIGGDAFAAQLAREQEDEERFGGSVELIMAWIMSEPADPSEEEANIARMASAFAGRPVPEPEPA